MGFRGLTDVKSIEDWLAIGATYDRRFGPSIPVSGYTTVSPSVGQFRAVPFVVPERCTADRIIWEVTTVGAAGSVGRAALWAKASTPGAVEPSALLVDGGEFDCTVLGPKETVISVPLAPNVLYFTTVVVGVAAPTVRGITGVMSPWGQPAALGSSNQHAVWSVSSSYGPMPATFPAGGAPAGLTCPLVALRLV